MDDVGTTTPTEALLYGLRIDKALPTPAYLQLKAQLAHAIEQGRLAIGSALPSERELADSLGLARMTVRRAFEDLVGAGLVEQRQGSGTYVRAGRLEQIIDRVHGFTDEAHALGFRPGSRLLEILKVPAERQLAPLFGVVEETPILRITRLRTANGEPLALQIAHLAPHLDDFPVADIENDGSLYRTIAHRYGVRPHRARQTVSARLPSHHESSLLEIPDTTPVLALERTTYDVEGRPFELVRSAYRSDIYQMSLDLRAPEG